MAITAQTASKLKAVGYRGLIAEDVMSRIFSLDPIPLPFTDAIGTGTAKNDYTEWLERKLPAPSLGNWRVDGADTDKNQVTNGARLGNHCGIQDQEVQVSGRAQASDTIGYGDELAEQLRLSGQKIRRNVEANLLGKQASQASNTDTDTAGIPAGFAAMVKAYDNGSGFANTGFANGSWSGLTPGTAKALKYTHIKGALSACYSDNADPTILMSVPGVIEALSDFMFTSNAPIATLQRDTKSVGAGGAATAVGAVNVLISNFGQTITFTPNRLQQTYADATTPTAKQVASVFLIDPEYADIAFLRGYRTLPLAKTGDADKRQMLVDFTLRVTNREAHRVIHDVDPTAAVTAS